MCQPHELGTGPGSNSTPPRPLSAPRDLNTAQRSPASEAPRAGREIIVETFAKRPQRCHRHRSICAGDSVAVQAREPAFARYASYVELRLAGTGKYVQ